MMFLLRPRVITLDSEVLAPDNSQPHHTVKWIDRNKNFATCIGLQSRAGKLLCSSKAGLSISAGNDEPVVE
jgi:hypothetical protein